MPRGTAASGWCMGLAVAASLLACHPGSSGTTTAPTPEPAPTEPEPDPDPGPPRCEPAGTRFDDLGWVPTDSPALASLKVDDPALPQALAALAEHTRGSGHGLPIPLAFSLSQWSWQVPLLVSTLDQAGFAPGELLFVAGDNADHAWVFRSQCDLERAIDNIESRWGLQSRQMVEGFVATARPDHEPAFPYDVVLLSGDRVALVPAGAASRITSKWSRPAAPTLSGRPAASIGAQLEDVPSAPIAVVVQGRALVDASVDATPDQVLRLRVDAGAVEVVTDE
ncbi:MAG: hypothetical protein AAF799_26380 [Myxococcota bacterium]